MSKLDKHDQYCGIVKTQQSSCQLNTILA